MEIVSSPFLWYWWLFSKDRVSWLLEGACVRPCGLRVEDNFGISSFLYRLLRKKNLDLEILYNY